MSVYWLFGGHAKGGQGPLMLVVTPTRELAQQIGEVCTAIAASTHHRILTVVGGLSYTPQINKLKHGVDILIATPGRLVDLMEQGAVRLGDVEVLVLDEADRMLDMGFWPAMKKIIGATPASRQTLLFSATIDASIKNSVGKLLHDPAFVEIAHKGETADTVEQYIVHVAQTLKPALLKAVLAEKGSDRVIVFARTRSRADSTCRRLKRAGYTAEAILRDIEKLIKRPIPEMEVPSFDAEQAAEEAAGKAARADARRDPEIKQAAKEMAARERKKAKAREQAQAEDAPRSAPKRKPSKKPAASKGAPPNRQQPGRANAKQGQPGQRSGKPASGGARPAQSSAKKGGPDLRPGRAHRASLAQQRSRGGKRK